MTEQGVERIIGKLEAYGKHNAENIAKMARDISEMRQHFEDKIEDLNAYRWKQIGMSTAIAAILSMFASVAMELFRK
jgi:hypothetical protein